MSQNFINNSIYGIDAIFKKYGLEETIGVNGYPILAVVFNLALLAVPYFIFIFLKKYKDRTGLKSVKNKIWALALGFLWLIFMPNVVYIISDIRHINGFCPADSAFRICVDTAWMIPFFFLYALAGVVAFVYLLNQMKNFVEEIFRKGKDIFVIFAIPLISLGFLLGLFNRWNSWEIFVNPLGILKTAALYFTDLTYFLNWLVFTGFLYVLYYGGSWLSYKIRNQT